MPIKWRWITIRRLWLLTVSVLIAQSLVGLNARATPPPLTLQICRANVAPCQNQVSIPQGGTVALDLVLSASPASGSADLLQVVGWETHFQLGNGSVANLDPAGPSGEPVQEQSASELALDGLLPPGGDPAVSQYFTAQNRYNPGSGRLDYAVTLVRFDPSKPQPRVAPLSNPPRQFLGRITVRGSAEGSSDITTGNLSASPFQVITLNPAGELHAVSPVVMASPLAIINVGNGTTPELTGKIGPPTADNGALPIPFPAELQISFWRSGAIPPWQGGNDLPVATFKKVVTDSRGVFRVTDIPPSLVPPGAYDLRVKGRRTLSSLVPGIDVPGPGGTGVPGSITPVSLGGLRDGDVDGNNVVDEADLLALRSSFGIPAAQAGFESNANFNGDTVVDVLDFSSLAQNYGKHGD